MKTSKRILSIFLALALCLGLLAITPITASAAAPVGPSPTAAWDFRDVDADGGGSYGSGTWSWVQATKTLTLTDISHVTSASDALRLPVGTTIVLNGTNTLTSIYTGSGTSGIYAGGNLTITGSGSLIATSGTTTGSSGASRGIYGGTGGGGLTVSGSATVTATGGTSTGSSFGIDLYGPLIINDGATVIATGDSRALLPSYTYTVPSGYKYYVSTTTTPSTTELTGNGSTTTIGSAYKYAKIVATAPVTINLAAIPGVTAPAYNATAVTTITETAQYTGTVSWSPALVGGKFAASTVYTATITLTPKSGYTLTGVAANFFTVAGATTVTNPAGSGVITAAFPATGAAPSSSKDILTFSIGGVGASISGTNIALTVPNGTNVTSLTPTITHSGASISPASGVAQNFTSPVNYTVTAEDSSTKTYAVTVTVAPAGTYALNVSAGTGGTVSGTASGSYTAGTAVSVTATASSGYHFVNWTVSGATITGGNTANPAAFSMPAGAVTLTANFALDAATKYNVTVSGGTTNKATAAAGETVTINAAPTSSFLTGQRFKEWTGAGVNFADKTKTTTTFTMPSQNVTVTAQYDSMIRLWGKTTGWASNFLNWLLCIVCFGWIWMAF